MKDLPELYNSVTTKRPDLWVKSMGIVPVKLYYSETCFGWYWDDDSLQHLRHVNHRVASALILARWVDALPDKHALTKLVSDSWAVWTFSTQPTVEGIRPTPLEALAAYYLS